MEKAQKSIDLNWAMNGLCFMGTTCLFSRSGSVSPSTWFVAGLGSSSSAAAEDPSWKRDKGQMAAQSKTRREIEEYNTKKVRTDMLTVLYNSCRA